MTFGVFGGSFDPPHVGHVMAAVYALSVGRLNGMVAVPTFDHPFNKDLVDFEHRLVMCQLAFDPIPDVDISAVEENLPTPSYMINTLTELSSLSEVEGMRLIIGNDCLREVDKWKDWDKIREIADPMVIPRHVEEGRYAVFPEISSTMVRAFCQRKEWDTVSRWVPASVVDYIRENNLYGEP